MSQLHEGSLKVYVKIELSPGSGVPPSHSEKSRVSKLLTYVV